MHSCPTSLAVPSTFDSRSSTLARSNVPTPIQSESLAWVGDPQSPTQLEVDAFLRVVAAILKRVLAEEAEVLK